MSLQNQNHSAPPSQKPRRTKISKDSIDFCKIGGLSSHINTLREVIIFPLLHGNVFAHFNIKAPKGVLFYGPPGTGKTLVAAALATEINKEGIGKVAFFPRKGADVLDKWVGGSEKNLRDLFEKFQVDKNALMVLTCPGKLRSLTYLQNMMACIPSNWIGQHQFNATKSKPAIIFFDELDGLAPVREKQTDQIHSSVVATLLALMDGLDNKPGVIVIGATNRIEAVDPALRRPGRFDKELYFPLPGAEARRQILEVHTGSWKHKPNTRLLSALVEATSGFSGADLQALCSEAIMRSMKRTYPTLQGIKVDPEKLKVEECDFLNASLCQIPSTQKNGLKMRKLTPIIRPLLDNQLQNIIKSIRTFWPHFLQENQKYIMGEERYAGRVLLIGNNMQGVDTHLIPAVLQQLEYLPAFIYDLTKVVSKNAISTAQLHFPSVILLSKVDEWWGIIDDCEQLSIVSSLEDIHAGLPILVIATCRRDIPAMLQNFFYNNSSILLKIEDPTDEERKVFLKPLFFDKSIVSLVSVLENCRKTEKESKRFARRDMIYECRGKKDKSLGNIITRSKRKMNSPSPTARKRQKGKECRNNLQRSNSVSSLYDIRKEIKYERENERNVKRCDSMSSLDPHDNAPYFTKVLCNLLDQRNAKNCSENGSACLKTLLSNKKINFQDNDIDVYAGSSLQDNDDAQMQHIYALWRHASLVTSKNMAVAQLELLYDVISACINIHWNSFDLLVKNFEDILRNIEITYNADY